jgi:hypothetical protein
MLLELRNDLLERLYDHAECDHETLLQAFVAYEMPHTDYRKLMGVIDGMNKFTRQAWDLETCPYYPPTNLTRARYMRAFLRLHLTNVSVPIILCT